MWPGVWSDTQERPPSSSRVASSIRSVGRGTAPMRPPTRRIMRYWSRRRHGGRPGPRPAPLRRAPPGELLAAPQGIGPPQGMRGAVGSVGGIDATCALRGATPISSTAISSGSSIGSKNVRNRRWVTTRAP